MLQSSAVSAHVDSGLGACAPIRSTLCTLSLASRECEFAPCTFCLEPWIIFPLRALCSMLFALHLMPHNQDKEIPDIKIGNIMISCREYLYYKYPQPKRATESMSVFVKSGFVTWRHIRRTGRSLSFAHMRSHFPARVPLRGTHEFRRQQWPGKPKPSAFPCTRSHDAGVGQQMILDGPFEESHCLYLPAAGGGERNRNTDACIPVANSGQSVKSVCRRRRLVPDNHLPL